MLWQSANQATAPSSFAFPHCQNDCEVLNFFIDRVKVVARTECQLPVVHNSLDRSPPINAT